MKLLIDQKQDLSSRNKDSIHKTCKIIPNMDPNMVLSLSMVLSLNMVLNLSTDLRMVFNVILSTVHIKKQQ